MTGLRTKAKQKAPAEAAKAEGLKNIIPDLPDAGTGAALDDVNSRATIPLTYYCVS